MRVRNTVSDTIMTGPKKAFVCVFCGFMFISEKMHVIPTLILQNKRLEQCMITRFRDVYHTQESFTDKCFFMKLARNALILNSEESCWY